MYITQTNYRPLARLNHFSNSHSRSTTRIKAPTTPSFGMAIMQDESNAREEIYQLAEKAWTAVIALLEVQQDKNNHALIED